MNEPELEKVSHCARKDFCGPEWDMALKALIFEHYSCYGTDCEHYKPNFNSE